MIGNVHIMGIVNLTPDSFYEASRVREADVIARIQDMFAEGADVIDLGACSTRPGSPQPSLEDEWARLEPALQEIRGYCPKGNSVRSALSGPSHCILRPLRELVSNGPLPLPLSGGGQVPLGLYPLISIDTYRSEIVRRAYEIIGPFIVNDISAGNIDSQMLTTVGRLELPYIAMHMRGTPENMQQFTDYTDIVDDVKAYFREFALRAADAGIREWILDPGFGFSKTLEQNYELLSRLSELQDLGREILVGVSRKSMIYKKLGITPEDALPATQVLHHAALERGATWLRVHDVAPAVQTALLHQSMLAAK